MKSIHKLAVAAILALSSAGIASATTYHVTGSTAYRVADVSAEVQICGGASALATYYGSSLTGANYSVVENSGGTIVFENYFNGSIAGDQVLVDTSTNKLPFPALAGNPAPIACTAASSTTAAGGGQAESAPSSTTNPSYVQDVAKPDLAFSDVSFDTADQIIEAPTNQDKTSAQPNGSVIVGIVPFVFVANGSSDVYSELSGLSMDPQKFTYVWASGGSATLSFFTGNNTSLDLNAIVYPLGRDVDSGTRGTALAETGYGLNGSDSITTLVQQFYPYNSTTNSNNNTLTGVVGVDTTLTNPTIAALNAVPAETIDNYSMPYADGGYYSGGNLATGISTAFASGVTETVEMTYLGVSDAKSALTSGTANNRQPAVLMAYNGVTFIPNPSTVSPSTSNSLLIEEGKYTFWGYEHLNYNSTGSAIASSFTTQLTGNSLDELSSAGVTASAMAVSRSDDGENVQ